MRKAWRFVGTVVLLLLVVGAVGIGVGFFMGSSPVVIQSHGSLEEYIRRLQQNGEVIRTYAEGLLAQARELLRQLLAMF